MAQEINHRVQPGIRWSTESIYVDIDTGEIITRKEANRNYITLYKKKQTNVNKQQTAGIVTITNHCQRNIQLRIQF